MKKYEKPSMTFMGVQADENVAATCWGGNLNKKNPLTWAYYGSDKVKSGSGDTDSGAWFSFQANVSDCAGVTSRNDLIITYHDANDTQKAKLDEEFAGLFTTSSKGSNWDGVSNGDTPIINPPISGSN